MNSLSLSRRSRLNPFLCLVACLLSSVVFAATPAVTVAVSSLKIRPSDSPAMQPAAEIRAAKNEFEAFQVVILGGSSGLTQVQVLKPQLTLVGSSVALPASEVRLYREQVTRYTRASSIDGAAGLWPDALVPDVEDGIAVSVGSGSGYELASSNEKRNAFPTQVTANQNVVVWVEVHVPSDAVAGRYTGVLTVTALAQGVPFSAQVPVGLLVRNFALPATSSLPTVFQLSVDNVCRAHGTVDGYGFCPDLATMHLWNRLYARFLLDHRITAQLSDVPNPNDWNGTYASYDAAYGELIHGTDLASRLKGASLTTVEYPWWQSGSTNSAAQVDRMRRFVSHARAGQWFAKTLDYSGDEPGNSSSRWSAATQRAAWAHQADPALRTLVTAAVDMYNLHAGASSGAVNVMTTVLDNLDNPPGFPYAGNQRDPRMGDTYAPFLAHNPLNQVWGYQSCDQQGCQTSSDPYTKNQPDFMVDATGVQNRAQPWMHYIYGLTGMLYYDTTLSLSTAWNTDGIWAFTGNGDGTFLYPGTPRPTGRNTYGIGGNTHIPVASYRLKMLRDGLEDYEYLKLCQARDPARAMRAARTLFPMNGQSGNGRESGSMFAAGNYPASTPATYAQNLEAAREELAACIVGTLPAAQGVLPLISSSQSGSSGTDVVHATTTDSAGNVYTAGFTTGVLDWGNSGGQDAFVAKRSGSGQLLWIRQLGSPLNDVARGVAVDGQGNVYIAGTTEAPLYDAYRGGAHDYFLAKYDAAGSRLFAHSFGTTDDDVANGIAVDASGNVFVAGATRGVLDWGNSGGWDAFIAKYDGEGNALWTRQLGSAGDELATALAVDGLGEVYITGTCSTALYDVYNGGPHDGFLAKYSASGTRLFTHSFGTSGDDIDAAVAVDSAGEVYVGGSTTGAFGGSSTGGWDATLARFGADGILRWKSQFGSSGDELAMGIGISSAGHIYLSGTTTRGFGNYQGGATDAFLVRYTVGGTRDALQSFGTSQGDSADSVAVDLAGNVYVGGTTGGTTLGATSAGGTDLFTRKFGP